MKNFEMTDSQMIEDSLTIPFAKVAYEGAIREAELSIAGKVQLEIFKQYRKTYHEGIWKVFVEGWSKHKKARLESDSRGYWCVASRNHKEAIGDDFQTLYSKEGKAKKKSDLPVLEWVPLPFFEALFPKRYWTISNGVLIVKHPTEMRKELERKKKRLNTIEHGPMHYVFDQYYSKEDFRRIEDAAPADLSRYISELENFGTDRARMIIEEDNFPLLAKGLTGFSKFIKRRREMRLEFFLTWAKCRRDLKTFAKEFNHPETRNWEWKPV